VVRPLMRRIVLLPRPAALHSRAHGVRVLTLGEFHTHASPLVAIQTVGINPPSGDPRDYLSWAP
jgi:hypothetical protein